MKLYRRFFISLAFAFVVIGFLSVQFIDPPKGELLAFLIWFELSILIALGIIYRPLVFVASLLSHRQWIQWIALFFGILLCMNLVCRLGGAFPTLELFTHSHPQRYNLFVGLHFTFGIAFISSLGSAYVWNLTSPDDEEDDQEVEKDFL